MKELGIEPWSFRRTANAFNHQATSPTLTRNFRRFKKLFWAILRNEKLQLVKMTGGPGYTYLVYIASSGRARWDSVSKIVIILINKIKWRQEAEVKNKLEVVAYTFNSTTWKAKKGRPLWVQGQPCLHSKLGYPGLQVKTLSNKKGGSKEH